MNNNKVINHSSVCLFFNHRPEHLIAIRTWRKNKLDYSDVFPTYLPVLLPEWSENITTQLHMAITEDVITMSSELLHLWCVHAFLCAFVRASINWKFVQKTTTTGFYPTCSASTSYLIWLYNTKKNSFESCNIHQMLFDVNWQRTDNILGGWGLGGGGGCWTDVIFCCSNARRV